MKQWLLLSLFTLICTSILASFTFHQSATIDQGLTIYDDSAHDTLWHLALMESLNQGVPPQNPLITGEKLVGYHYFNDLVWVGVHRLTGISLVTLYLKIAPVVLAAFFSFTTLLLFRKVFTPLPTAYLGASIAIIGANFAYLVPLFFPQSLALQSVFWVDQTIHLGINQQLLLSLALMNIFYLLFFTSLQKYWLPIGVLVGIMVSIKVYATLLVLPILMLLAVFQWYWKKETSLAKASAVSLLTALPLLLITGNKNGFPFFWEPGWFFKTMFESGDRLNFPRWEMMRVNAVAEGDWLRLIILWVSAAGIFFVGNFGVKILGLLAVPYLLMNRATRFNLFWWLLGAIVLGSFAIPTFMLQKGVAWNTIQFLPYAYVPLALLLTYLVEQRVRNRQWRLSVLVTALIISLPTTLITASMNFKSDPQVYRHFSADFVTSLSDVSNNYPSKEYIVGSTLYTYSTVPALTGKPVYWADEVILTILANQHPERKEFIRRLELGETNCESHQVLVELYQGKAVVLECPLVIPPPPEMVPHLYQIEEGT